MKSVALDRVHLPQDHGKICERCAIPVYHVVGRVWRHCTPKFPGQRTCGLPPKPVDSESRQKESPGAGERNESPA
jgi:hypothetical protein